MKRSNEQILEQIKGGLIVSCQALSTEPLYDSYIMSKMAYAAMLGGAVGIRANTVVDIPETPCMVEMDSLQISRVVTNLINNSIRHNEPGTTIALEFKDIFYNREIIISDDGDQIDESVVEHIFEPFAVGDASRRTKGGSGLGLSIAKRIVEMHGWNIELFQNKRGYKKAFIINVK